MIHAHGPRREGRGECVVLIFVVDFRYFEPRNLHAQHGLTEGPFVSHASVASESTEVCAESTQGC